MHAVTVEPLQLIFFVTGDPGPGDWTVEEDVDLDLPGNIVIWADGDPIPEQVLCRSLKEKGLFKLVKHARDIDRHEYEPTNLWFGGIFSRRTWARFAELLPGEIAFFRLGEEVSETRDGATRQPTV